MRSVNTRTGGPPAGAAPGSVVSRLYRYVWSRRSRGVGRNVEVSSPVPAPATNGATPDGGLWFTSVPCLYETDQASHFSHSLSSESFVSWISNGRSSNSSNARSCDTSSLVSPTSFTSQDALSDRSRSPPFRSQVNAVVNFGPTFTIGPSGRRTSWSSCTISRTPTRGTKPSGAVNDGLRSRYCAE